MDHGQWNENWFRYRDFNRRKLRYIYDRLGIDTLSRDARILDLGCGTGDFIRILQEDGFRFVRGLEPQPELVREAGMDCVTEGNCLGDLPDASSFDAVVMFGVLHHLKSFDEVIQALQNVYALLRPGGRFFSAEPRRTLARSIMTRLMVALPKAMLPGRIQIERMLFEEERVDMNRWLGYERTVPSRATTLGFRVERRTTDWKSAYQVLAK